MASLLATEAVSLLLHVMTTRNSATQNSNRSAIKRVITLTTKPPTTNVEAHDFFAVEVLRVRYFSNDVLLIFLLLVRIKNH